MFLLDALFVMGPRLVQLLARRAVHRGVGHDICRIQVAAKLPRSRPVVVRCWKRLAYAHIVQFLKQVRPQEGGLMGNNGKPSYLIGIDRCLASGVIAVVCLCIIEVEDRGSFCGGNYCERAQRQ